MEFSSCSSGSRHGCRYTSPLFSSARRLSHAAPFWRWHYVLFFAAGFCLAVLPNNKMPAHARAMAAGFFARCLRSAANGIRSVMAFESGYQDLIRCERWLFEERT
jgi:hypothetical protein